MISFSCDNCGKEFNVSSDKGGKTAKCPGCGHLLHIPVDGANPPPPGIRPAVAIPSRASHRPARHHRLSAEAHARSSQAARQRANMILLSVVLLIGFAMPTVQFNPFTQERTAELVNITVLTSEHAPMQLKIFCLAPCVAGIGLLILQGFTKHPIRGVIVIFLAVIPAIIALTGLKSMGPSVAFIRHIPPEAALRMLVNFMGMFVAPIALLVGVRARGYRPDSSVAYWFGVGGAVAWFAFLLIPVQSAQNGYISLMFPIKLIGRPNAGGLSMGLLVLMVCTSVSAILCITNKPASETQKARSQANMAYWTLAVGFFVFLLCISGRYIENFASFINSIKGLCWFVGMGLLIPVGVTDLVVGRAHHHKHRSHETPHPHTAPPDIPKRAI